MEQLELVLKKLHHQLSDEERILFDKWIAENKKNKQFYHMLKDLKGKGKDLQRLSEVDVNETWEKILNRKSDISPKIIPFYKKSFFRYGVAASILLLLSLTYLFAPTKEESSTPQEIVNNKITKGSNKATLTLENGTIVVLEKGKVFNTEIATSNGEKLIYQNDKFHAQSAPVYNYLTIPRGGEFYLELADKTKVWLNSETKLKYPVSFTDGETRQVELVYGEAYFDVSSSTKHNGSKFEVINQNQKIEVLGTEFNIKAYKDENYIYTTLVEGSLNVITENGKKLLKPNQQSVVDLSNMSIGISEINVFDEISWKDGVFSFKDKSLKEIMKVLSRWYDMNVVFTKNEMEDEEFIGVLGRTQSIEGVLSIIKDFGIIKDYEINNRTVTLK
ncbi:DUF4974 domain-containing protein [Flavobacteriaceae bacterium F08102]|nr:DUF4974 domain-containing protein [Flavobacteriaceae bacterium F08102]